MAKKIITECNNCKDKTNHSVMYSKKVIHTYKEDNALNKSQKTVEDNMVVQCKGCNQISFLLRRSGSFLYYGDDKIKYHDWNYPEIDYDEGDYRFLERDEKKYLPKKMTRLYEEVEHAFENEDNILAGVGLRMLVESICLEQNITGANLKVKIEKIHHHGLISKNAIPILDTLREIGNISAHEIKSFSLSKLEYALDILNNVLKSIYVLPAIKKKLKLK
jgi:Domain of unknown function (DUF4145)